MELSRPVIVQHHGHLALTLNFQGQILKMFYLRNGRADWHGTKKMWIDRMLHPFCDFHFDLNHDHALGFSKSNFEKVVSQGWDGWLTWNERDVSRQNAGLMLWLSTFTSPMTLTLDFQGQISKKLYLRDGMADWHGTKGMWVDRMSDTCCDFQHSPQPWAWPWIFLCKILKLLYLRNGKVDSLGMKGMWVGYDVGCTKVLTLGHGAWQISRPSNRSLWNCYSFQAGAQWIGYSFTDLGLRGVVILWTPC